LLAERSHKLSADIIIVGAGVAGVASAAVLGRQGWRVLLVDARPACPPVFKAEKVERDELRLLADLGLLERLTPHAGLVSETFAAYDGRVFRRLAAEHIGIAYADLVNTIRANLPAAVETKVGYVNRISRKDETIRVRLADGQELTARLVVVACGVGDELLSGLGLRRSVIQKEQCTALGFNIVAAGARTFPFQAVTYYATDAASCIDYVTFFKIRDAMRANLFVFRAESDPWIQEFHREPRAALERALPKLPRVIGEYEVAGKVVSGSVDLYRAEGEMPDGVVFIGDALQSACPSTGLGLKKVFTDVAVLGECVPAWFSTPGMSAGKLKSFYGDPRKRSRDSHALRQSFHHRRAAIDPSPRWRIHRALLHLKWRLSRPKDLPAYFREMNIKALNKGYEHGQKAKAGSPPELEEVVYERE